MKRDCLHRVLFCALAVLACVGVLRYAQAAEDNVRVAPSLEQTQVYLGESVIYEVMVHNLPESPEPDLAAFSKDFKVEKIGDQSLNRTSLVIINGERSDNSVYGHQFRYRLTALKAGKIEVPEALLTVDGKVYHGRALTLEVLQPEKQDIVLLETEVQPKRIYPEVAFKVMARVLIKPIAGSERNPVSLLRPSSWTIPWVPNLPQDVKAEWDLNKLLSPMISRDQRGFNISNLTARSNDPFSMFDRAREVVFMPPARREKRKGLDGSEINYWVFEISFPFSSSKPGKYSLGSMTLRGPFITGRDQRSFLTRDIYVAAPDTVIDVIDLLSKHAPADYTGAVNQIDLRAMAQPESLRVGDPLTLTVEIRNGGKEGLLKLIGPPDLARIEGFEKDFTIIDAKPVGEIVDTAKQFKFALRPKHPGVSIPAISMSWFDPEKETFQQSATHPIPLKVEESAKIGGAEVYAATNSTKDPVALKQVEGGIFRNMTELDEPGARWLGSLYAFGLPVLLLVLYAAMATVAARQRRLAADPARQRRGKALREFRQRVGAHADAASIRAAMLGVVADLRNLPEAGLTPRDADQALQAGLVSEEARTELRAILEALESAAYGGGGVDLTALQTRSLALAERLVREVKA